MAGEGIVRVSRRKPCPVCGKPDWCGLLVDGSACICMRVEQGAVSRTRNGGWLHRLRDTRYVRGCRQVGLRVTGRRNGSQTALAQGAAAFQRTADRAKLQRFAARLGVSVRSLRRLEVGWSLCHRAWSFPMKDGGRTVGIRLRSWAGRKWSVRGGHEGLFVPHGLGCSGRLLLPEGPTDVATLLDLGFEAVGRPSCTGGVRSLVRFIRSRKPREAVVVADRDVHGAGQRGAGSLAAVLVVHCPVRVIAPPPPFADVRDWRRAGATNADIVALCAATPARRLVVSVSVAGPPGRARR